MVGNKTDSSENIGNKIRKATARCPTAVVKINGHPINCLLDTGAEVSTISESFFKNYLSSSELFDTTKYLKLSAANKIQIPYLGYIEVDLKVSGCQFDNVGMLVENITSESDSVQAVLGCNILNKIRNETEESSQILEEESWKNVISVMKLDEWSERTSFVKVAGIQAIKIPANSMKTVIGSTRCIQEGKTYTAAVQAVSCENGSLPRNIMVIDTIANVEQGKIPIRVLNIGPEDVWLEPKTRLGTLQSAEVIRSSDDEFRVEFTSTEVSIRKIRGNTESQQNLGKIDFDLGDVVLTNQQRERLDNMFVKHRDAFALNDDELGFTSTIKHPIRLSDDTPIKIPHRRIPPNQLDEVKRHIHKLLNQGIIRKSSSPYASALVIVR